MPDPTEPRVGLDAVLAELAELGECWLEVRVVRGDTAQLDTAIDQAVRESRRIERKLRRLLVESP